MENEFEMLFEFMKDFDRRTTHHLDEIGAKLDSHGERLTRIEMTTKNNCDRIDQIEKFPTKKRENWKTWLAIIGGILGVAAVVIPVLITLAKWFDSVKQVIGG